MRLRELPVRQAELNAALNLDKGERQIAPPTAGEGGTEIEKRRSGRGGFGCGRIATERAGTQAARD